MKQTGAIVKVETEINHLNALFERWQKGEIDNVDMAHLIRRTTKKLEKMNSICYCDEGVCCAAHNKHNDGIHLNCILR